MRTFGTTWSVNRWAIAMLAAWLSGCAALSGVEAPPPPGYQGDEVLQTKAAEAQHTPWQAPVAQATRPPSGLRTIPAAPAPQAYSAPAPIARSSVRPAEAMTTAPLTLPAAPVIYYAPSSPAPLAASYSRSSPQVLQAQPGPALSLDFNPNPAWKNAVVPEGSKAATVGRVSPPAAIPGFTIGAGDTVQVDVLGRPELTARGNVSGDGSVTVALVGAVNVKGLTTAQAAERIGRAYRDGQYLVAPQVTVTLAEYQSQQLTVLGEVRNPGRYPMRTRLSVLDGLALSGGISDDGASLAYLLRPEDSVVTRYEIDLDELIQNGAGQQYFELLAGDTLVVPKALRFYIYGEVKSPNAYKLKPGMSVIQALSLSGGLTDKGSDRRIDIRRRDQNGRLRSLSASLNDVLQADDVLYVRERLF